MSTTLEIAKNLIARPSITPMDEGCQDYLISLLDNMGFHSQRLPFEDVDNLWSVWGDTGPLLVFAGHTDVVPTGPESNWRHPPFTPTEEAGYLYGRGAADMKSSLAAMVTACQSFLAKHSQPIGRIGFLITSDEEGIAVNGTVKVVEWLQKQDKLMDWCVVGEPSSVDVLGDVVKNGRRGSLGAQIHIKGQQGHVAYPHLAKNPIHAVAPALAELCAQEWDQGNEFFPPTSFQISNIHGGTGANNVIPGHLDIVSNFRFSTESTAESLQQRVETILNQYDFDYDIHWNLSGLPFITESGALIEASKAAIKEVTQLDTRLSTEGGTSDGRFIAPLGVQVIEIGPSNRTIHQIDECIKIDDLENLSRIYQGILERLLSK